MSISNNNGFAYLIFSIFSRASFIDPAHEAQNIRRDANGKKIRLSDLGDDESAFGWFIDLSSNGDSVSGGSPLYVPIHIADYVQKHLPPDFNRNWSAHRPSELPSRDEVAQRIGEVSGVAIRSDRDDQVGVDGGRNECVGDQRNEELDPHYLHGELVAS